MIKFTYETPDIHKEFTAVKSVTMEVEDEQDLTSMLDAYKDFLVAIGYRIPVGSYIDVVEEE